MREAMHDLCRKPHQRAEQKKKKQYRECRDLRIRRCVFASKLRLRRPSKLQNGGTLDTLRVHFLLHQSHYTKGQGVSQPPGDRAVHPPFASGVLFPEMEVRSSAGGCVCVCVRMSLILCMLGATGHPRVGFYEALLAALGECSRFCPCLGMTRRCMRCLVPTSGGTQVACRKGVLEAQPLQDSFVGFEKK